MMDYSSKNVILHYIIVISQVYSKLEHSEFSSHFEFDRNMLSGTGARTHTNSPFELFAVELRETIDGPVVQLMGCHPFAVVRHENHVFGRLII